MGKLLLALQGMHMEACDVVLYRILNKQFIWFEFRALEFLCILRNSNRLAIVGRVSTEYDQEYWFVLASLISYLFSMLD